MDSIKGGAMASKYYDWKYRDVKPDEKKEMTKEEKMKNWWYYHWKTLLVSVIVLIPCGNLLFTMLGIGETKPDIQVALVTDSSFSQNAADALQEKLTEYAGDYNRDGKVVVTVNVYASSIDEESQISVYSTYASGVSLISDLDECRSYIFLIEDPKTFQEKYEILAYTDGTLPETGEDYEKCVYSWNELPALTSLDLSDYGTSQEIFSNLYVGRRGFWTSKTVDNLEQCTEFWDTITAR